MSADQAELEFLAELRKEFFESIFLDLDDCEGLILKYDQSSDVEVLEELKRKLHTIKGSAHAVELKEVSQKVHEVETSVTQLADSKQHKELVDLVLKTIDRLRELSENEANAG